jgi:hypothetical protein
MVATSKSRLGSDGSVGADMDPGEFPEVRIQEMVSRVAVYLREEREVYVRHSEPLTADLRAAI